MRYYFLVGAVVAAMAAWAGFWFFAAGQVRTEIERHAGESTPARDWTYQDLDISGFPFRIQADLKQSRLDLRGGSGALSWETDHIKAVGHPWQPRHVLLDLSGRHLFIAMRREKPRQFSLNNRKALASLETGGEGELARLSLDINDMELSYAGAAAMRAARLQLHGRPNPEQPDAFDLALRGEAVDLLEGARRLNLAGLPRAAQLLDLQTTVTGLEGTMAVAGGLAHWRDDGGTLEINKLHLQWGDIEITASGSLALDDRMRAIGALTARIKGHNELLKLAVANGAMEKKNLLPARAVLGLLAAAAGGVLSVPVRLQDGTLFLGPAAIARLAPIVGE
ncbi:MAG: DUF2125 domain-containing protein [Alphaproteobacteria bacterium]|nr:DUF2125 domain-containing protein [Alphaproteobacteria bacterium]